MTDDSSAGRHARPGERIGGASGPAELKKGEVLADPLG
jgi:hypothetical protein